MRRFIRAIKTPVTLIVLLAVLGFGAKWGYEQFTKDTATPSAATCVMTDVGEELLPKHVTVKVLNGGTKARHAKDTRAFLLAYKFHVPTATNSERKVVTTTIIGHAADSPEVRLVAQMFEGAVTEGDGRKDHVVDVIVPTKNQELTKPPTTGIPVDGKVCLPVIPITDASATATPSASPSATKK